MEGYGVKFIDDFMCSEHLQNVALKSVNAWLSRIKTYPTTIYDCGANVGTYSIAFASQTSSRIIAFEPVAKTYEKLIKNISLNGLEDRVKAFNFGLWSSDCELVLGQPVHRDSENTGLYSVHYSGGKNIVCSKFRKASNVIDECGLPGFLKLDVEGAEYEILSSLGSENLIKIAAIAVEKNCEMLPLYADVSALLTSLSFIAYEPHSNRKSYDVLWLNSNVI
jgi:FkbM family methyltransferase